MVKTAENRITIMLGGMTKEILESAINFTDATEFHLVCSKRFCSYEGDINTKALKEIVMSTPKHTIKITYNHE